MNPKHLRPADLHEGAIKRLLSEMLGRLNELREQNDNRNLDAEKTALLRGRIDELKQWMALLSRPSKQPTPNWAPVISDNDGDDD